LQFRLQQLIGFLLTDYLAVSNQSIYTTHPINVQPINRLKAKIVNLLGWSQLNDIVEGRKYISYAIMTTIAMPELNVYFIIVG